MADSTHHPVRPGLHIAGMRQFFTGKLYVPVVLLKLPAEELPRSALRPLKEDQDTVHTASS